MEKQISQSDKATALLVRKFEEGKAKNARWSQRAFAAKLGLSSGALSEILQGKRILTPQLKKKIVQKLQLSPLEQVEFFNDELPGHLKSQKMEYHRLSNDQFHLISDWWHFAILNLLNLKNFKSDTLWISQRLGLSPKVTQEAWDRLIRLGYIVQAGRKYQRGFPRIESSDDLFNLSVQKSHLQDLELIENSIQNYPIELRDHTALTFAVHKKDIKKAKELIRDFQDRFCAEIEVKQGDAVYKLSMSLFPLTKEEEV